MIARYINDIFIKTFNELYGKLKPFQSDVNVAGQNNKISIGFRRNEVVSHLKMQIREKLEFHKNLLNLILAGRLINMLLATGQHIAIYAYRSPGLPTAVTYFG